MLFKNGLKDFFQKYLTSKTSYSYYYNETRSSLGYAGIRNLGCICYMNAMIQQFYMTKAFRTLIFVANDFLEP